MAQAPIEPVACETSLTDELLRRRLSLYDPLEQFIRQSDN